MAGIVGGVDSLFGSRRRISCGGSRWAEKGQSKQETQKEWVVPEGETVAEQIILVGAKAERGTGGKSCEGISVHRKRSQAVKAGRAGRKKGRKLGRGKTQPGMLKRKPEHDGTGGSDSGAEGSQRL